MADIKKLTEGVRFCNVKTDRFKTSKILVTMAMPMDNKMSANALLINLLKYSCKKYSDFAALNQRLDELYGAYVSASVSKIGESQALSLGISCIDDRFALDQNESISGECAELLCSMLFEPDVIEGAFRQEAFDDVKRLVLQMKEEEVNDKRAFARQRCEEIMCADERYGKNRYGTVEEIEAVTPADVYAAWQNLLKTAVVMITCVSSSDGKQVEKIFKKGFSKIEREPAVIETEFRERIRRFKRIEENFAVNQGKLVLGFRSGMSNRLDNYAAEMIMIDIFGGNVYSKLFLNVREKLSLCYYCWARLISQKGIVFVDCGIDAANERKATAEIIKQLGDMREGKFTDDDIAASKMSKRSSLLGMDDPGSIALWYGTYVLFDEVLSPEELLEKLEAVTKEEICAAAKRMALETIYMLSPEEGKSDET